MFSLQTIFGKGDKFYGLLKQVPPQRASTRGWRIIKTLGFKMMVKLDPINGFAAETSGASVILIGLMYCAVAP